MEDFDLLDQYARRRSDAAFAEIVRRYAGLVYSSARRQLRDPADAEDVTQAVFPALAPKAGSPPATVGLPSWLLTPPRPPPSHPHGLASPRKDPERRAAA